MKINGVVRFDNVKLAFVGDTSNKQFVENIGNEVHHRHTWSQLTGQNLTQHKRLTSFNHSNSSSAQCVNSFRHMPGF